MIDFKKVEKYLDGLKDYLFKQRNVKIVSYSDFREQLKMLNNVKKHFFENTEGVEKSDVPNDQSIRIHNGSNEHFSEFSTSPRNRHHSGS